MPAKESEHAEIVSGLEKSRVLILITPVSAINASFK